MHNHGHLCRMMEDVCVCIWPHGWEHCTLHMRLAAAVCCAVLVACGSRARPWPAEPSTTGFEAVGVPRLLPLVGRWQRVRRAHSRGTQAALSCTSRVAMAHNTGGARAAVQPASNALTTWEVHKTVGTTMQWRTRCSLASNVNICP